MIKKNWPTCPKSCFTKRCGGGHSVECDNNWMRYWRNAKPVVKQEDTNGR